MYRQSIGRLWSQLLLVGFSSAHFFQVHQESVSGAVNQSVLLPAFYKRESWFATGQVIEWILNHSRVTLATYKLNNCSLRDDGIPINCTGSHFVHPEYENRVVFFPENASLRLKNLQLSDSGVYTISFKDLHQSRDINLTVTDSGARPGIGTAGGKTKNGTEDSMGSTHTALLAGSAAGGCTTLALLLLLLYCALKPKRKRIIQQQQAQNQDDMLLLEDLSVITGQPRNAVYLNIAEASGSRLSIPATMTDYAELSFSEEHGRPAVSTYTL